MDKRHLPKYVKLHVAISINFLILFVWQLRDLHRTALHLCSEICHMHRSCNKSSDEIQILRLIRHSTIVFTASMTSLWVGTDIYVQHKKSVNVRVIPRIWDLLSSMHLKPAYTVLILDVTDVDLILQAGDIENPPIMLPMSREGPMPLHSSSFSFARWASEDEYHLDPALTGCTTCISLHISSCQTYSEELRFLVAKKTKANKFIPRVKFMKYLCSYKKKV